MHGRVFVQRPVRPNAIIVACIGAQHAPQMPLANDNDVVRFSPSGVSERTARRSTSIRTESTCQHMEAELFDDRRSNAAAARPLAATARTRLNARNGGSLRAIMLVSSLVSMSGSHTGQEHRRWARACAPAVKELAEVRARGSFALETVD